MDRNNLIGISLIFLILIGWYYWMGKQREQYVQTQPLTADTVTIPAIKSIPGDTNITNFDSISLLRATKTYGDWAGATIGSEETSMLENSVFKITFSNKGGRISQVELKDYDKEYMATQRERAKTKVLLLEDTKNRFNYQIPSSSGLINTSDLYF